MDEFDLIETYFKPLSAGFSGSFFLSDDAAIITPPAGHDLVATKDAISQGIHFVGDENPALIAKKLLRVNLSDLAAMGATPLCYLLALMLPKNTSAQWIQQFAQGLGEDQALFNFHLAGGDTISTHGLLSFSLTAFGIVPTGKALRRNAAKIGDGIYVSGTLGDSALGLLGLQNKIAKDSYLTDRYLLPIPRIELGQQLQCIAHACMDISDGLVQDLGHMCSASKAGAMIERKLIPLSPSAKALIVSDQTLWDKIVSGGDDYELLFTAPPNEEKNIPKNCTRIGEIVSDAGVILLDDAGQPIDVRTKGFRHF